MMKRCRALPTGVWVLGCVSLFMDISSELIHSLLPVFMATVLGASMTTIGIIEGVAEAAAAISKIFSGIISDFLGKRKLLAGLGYGLAAVTKPIFPLATSIGWVFAARFIDRIGKGVRGAPRDALIADIAPKEIRGAAYGLRQSLDSLGAMIGPLTAVVCMIWFVMDIKTVLWVAVVPAFIALALLVFGVREPVKAKNHTGTRNTLTFNQIARLPFHLWLVVLLGAVFTLARFSEAFLILRAKDVGVEIGYVPMVLIAMNIAYTMTAFPAGIAADHLNQYQLFIVGLTSLIAAHLVLAFAGSPFPAYLGAGFWGIHLGFTQGLFSKLVADSVRAELRGAAFGIFNFTTGVALLLSSLIAGFLWSAFGPPFTFLAGALFAFLTILGLLTFRKRSVIITR